MAQIKLLRLTLPEGNDAAVVTKVDREAGEFEGTVTALFGIRFIDGEPHVAVIDKDGRNRTSRFHALVVREDMPFETSYGLGMGLTSFDVDLGHFESGGVHYHAFGVNPKDAW